MSKVTNTVTNTVDTEPVVVGHAVLWVLTNVAALVAERTNVLDAGTWSLLVQLLVPVVTAAVLAVFAWVQRSKVFPVVKAVEQQVVSAGLTKEQLEEIVARVVAALREQNQLNALATPPVTTTP